MYFGRLISKFRETSYVHLYVLSANTEEQLAFTVTAGKISAPAIVRLVCNPQTIVSVETRSLTLPSVTESSLHFHIFFQYNTFYYSFIYAHLSNGLVPCGFQTKISYAFLFSTSVPNERKITCAAAGMVSESRFKTNLNPFKQRPPSF